MKFQYGKQDWKTFERGEENCYLMTNGLGGFSSLSMIASCSRGDQAVLMACTHSPNHRYNMVHRLEETLELGDMPYPFKRVFLSSQDFQCHEKRENGYGLQTGFSYEDYPVWTYLTEGVEVVRTLALMQGRNVVGVSYRIRNRSQHAVTLRVRPHLQFVPKGQRLSVGQEFLFAENRITSNGQTLFLRTNGVCQEIPTQYHEDLYYQDDVKDGKMALGRTAVNHEIYFTVEQGQEESLEIVYGMEENLPHMTEILQNVSDHRKNLQERFHDETARALAASADQFISYRESTRQKTILAGFPFFEDWGRDTMIALVGCCLSTGQYDTAQSILRTFMAHCRRGLMPNLFPEGTQAPAYNTVDAALLFILAVYEYLRRTGDNVFVRQAYPVMQDIIRWYAKGTDYGIHMDQDGLISAGQGYDQVTWMDVRVEDILPTPRHGKPVEINAYWYNALRIMEELSRGQTRETGKQSREGQFQDEIDYGAMADRVYAVFETLYWNPEKECLRDVISGTAADNQVRCNQIWAVSLPFSLLSREKEIQVVEAVYRKLYTPVGLRTLAPEDDQFHPFYGGAQLDRDLAYHQGTVWTFPLGGYYLAYLKVHDYSRQAKAYVKEQLRGIETALREGCVAQLPEIYDGGNPVSSKGCFAQAWSVGEILRVYEVLEHV
ncbi:MAG: glycogen debranching protein [Lachnospiraceae bacterium]|nr:glycogen debranching protein [Lachnospiraceae bacterium]